MSALRKEWCVGDKVRHSQDGPGTIVQVDQANSAFRYLVQFYDGAKKWYPVWEIFTSSVSSQNQSQKRVG